MGWLKEKAKKWIAARKEKEAYDNMVHKAVLARYRQEVFKNKMKYAGEKAKADVKRAYGIGQKSQAVKKTSGLKKLGESAEDIVNAFG